MTNEPASARHPDPARHSSLEQWRRRVGRRLAALGAVGSLMVALPLVQVLRFQNAELEALDAARARIDPVAQTVQVQRGLLAHRDIAARVLAGRSALEAERRLRQGEVDVRLSALATALATGPWPRAVDEHEALRDDWSLLARQLLTGSFGIAENEHAHRLLIEQTLQIIDLVADGGNQATKVAAAVPQPALLTVAQAAPQLAWQLAALTSEPALDQRQQRQRAAAEAAVARTLGLLNNVLTTAPHAGLDRAGTAAGVAADRYFHLLQSTAPPAAELQEAAAAAWATQLALFEHASAEAALQIDTRASQAVLLRDRGAVAMLTLAALALLLAGAVWRSWRQAAFEALPASAPLPAVAPAQHARRLLERLRGGGRERRTADAQLSTVPGEL